MSCEHENADHLMPGERFQRYGKLPDRVGPMEDVLVEQFRCLDCGKWLSLGPSNDLGEHAVAVAVEIRAAEIATESSIVDAWLRCAISDGERIGWDLHDNKDEAPTSGVEEAGYLARCIATHQEPLTLDDVKSALAVGAEERKAAEQVRRKR